jgi:hypothetical protein
MAGSNPKNSRPAATSKAAPAKAPAAAKPEPEKAAKGPAKAKLSFEAGWKHSAQGELVAGGQVTIAYDPNRAQLKADKNGGWGVQAFVKMIPSGQVVEQPVIDAAKARPATLEIPKGTTEVQIWFKNWVGEGGPRESWDSNLGKNYCFAVRG